MFEALCGKKKCTSNMHVCGHLQKLFLDYVPVFSVAFHLCGWVQGNSDGPLVAMMRLVPLDNDVIPMVLLLNMHLIKGAWIILSCGVAGYRAILMGHWYQWYNWYY